VVGTLKRASTRHGAPALGLFARERFFLHCSSLNVKTGSMKKWTYLKSTLTGERQVGPVSDQEFVDAIKSDVIKPGTKVFVDGRWSLAHELPFYQTQIRVIEDAKLLRRQQKKQQARLAKEEKAKTSAVRKQAKKEAGEQTLIERQQKEAIAKSERESLLSNPIYHGNMLEKINDRLADIQSNVRTIGWIVIFYVLVFEIGGCIAAL